jgi:signal transduction histidine kinase
MTRLPIYGLGLGRLVRGLVLLLPALFIPAAEAAEPKRVLIIHSFGRDYAPFNSVGIALRTELTKQLRQPVTFRDVSLEIERFGVPRKERALIEYVRSSSDETPDMVITLGAPAARFYLRHREVLFPDRPLLISGIDIRMLRDVKLGARDRTVTVDQAFARVARTIRTLQPNTTTLALVLGASPHEQFWAEEIRREFEQADSHLRVLPPEAMSLEQMRQRVSGLPPNSAVFYFMFNTGADGVQHENEQALAAIREVSSAPIYGMYANQLGAGVVGGALFDLRRMGRVTAELAASMLESGQGADSNKFVGAEPPAFDWRELERWGIPESRLPPGAEVRFRPPSLWEQHRLLILAGAAIVVLQAALIAALLAQRRIRRRAEFEQREGEQRMSLVAAATGLGMWVEDIPRRTFWASPQQFALLGIATSEPYNFERFLQAVHADDRAAVREAIARAMESGGEYDVQYRVALANGAVRWIAARGRGEVDARGRPVRMRGVTADVTARVEAGIEARQHQNELAHLSRVAMLGQLSGSLAHELNQPLTAILSNAQAALRFLKADGADLQEIREILADIVVDDQRAGNVIRRLRALFERGEANQEPLDLNELIRETLRLLHSDFISRNISVATDLEPGLPLIAFSCSNCC